MCHAFVTNIVSTQPWHSLCIDFSNHFRYLPFISEFTFNDSCKWILTNRCTNVENWSNTISINVWSVFWIEVKLNVWVHGNWIHQRIFYLDDWLVDWVAVYSLFSFCFWTQVQSYLIFLIRWTIKSLTPKCQRIN